jgi:HAD superfamily hydrolase (TIGR01490 family)
MRLALFDLDSTLIPFDSDHAWGAFVVRLGWVDEAVYAQKNEYFYAQYKAGTLDIYEYLDFALKPLAEHSMAELQAAHQRFMLEIVAPKLHPAGRALVQKHQDAGDTCVVITATNAFVTRPIARVLGIEELIAVNLEVRDGQFTGKPEGTLSFQGGKLERIRSWCAERGLKFEDCESYFYSDSINDRVLLEAATHAIATNPDDKLRALAHERAWTCLDLWPHD